MGKQNGLILRVLALALAAQIAVLPAFEVRVLAAENADRGETSAAAHSTQWETAEESEPEEEPAKEEEERYAASQIIEEISVEEETGNVPAQDPDELLEAYLANRFSGSAEPADPADRRKLRAATRSLTGLSADVYAAVLEEIRKIADGESDSSVIEVPISGYLEKKSFTKEELGVDTIYQVTVTEETEADGSVTQNTTYRLSAEAREALCRVIGWEARKVVGFLLANCPYELYWYDKTQNYMHSITLSYLPPEETVVIPEEARVRLYLPVSADYAAAGSGDPSFTPDTAKTGAARAAVQKAKEIVSGAAGLSDWDKLTAYRDAVLKLASYDYEAAGSGGAYGDPWQIIHVFDGDRSTRVVCEGYAKAFQYLCDLTPWDRQIECRTLTGTLGTLNPVNHMWNVVSLWDGCNFIVDLTNCDDGQAGYPDQLFMTGAEDYDKGAFTLLDGSLAYRCDGEMEELYTEESIRLTDRKAHDPHYYEGMEPVFTWDREKKTCRAAVVCGLCKETHYFDASVQEEDGPEKGQKKLTAVFDAEDHSFTDVLIVEGPQTDPPGDGKKEQKPSGDDPKEQKPSGEGSKEREPAGGKTEEDSSGSGREQAAHSGEKEDGGRKEEASKAPRVGDMNGDSVRNLIGVILLCLGAIAAVIAIARSSWPQIREICTDENGKFDLIGGLERHFAKGAGTADTEEDDLAATDPDKDFMTMLRRQRGEEMADLDPERDPIREHIIFYGRVQGVGFRYQAMYAARSFDLTGWVENLPDGSVEMEVQGTPAGIGKLMKHLRSGHWIRIDDMDIESRPLVPGERGFGVKGY